MMHTDALISTYIRAQAYAAAVDDVKHFQNVLSGGYSAWREETRNYEILKRGSDGWSAMMIATQVEYRYLVNAKARERRARYKLLAIIKEGK